VIPAGAGFGPFLVLDLAAGFMLAAAASGLARAGGSRSGGALALACLAGTAAPLLRDTLLGLPLLALDQPAYLAAALTGGLAGLPLPRLRRAGLCLALADALGLALATGLAAAKGAVLGLGAAGVLLLALLSGLAGGLVRDTLLGNTALAMEEDLYATAAALGAVVSLACVWHARLPPWQCALAGAACILLLRAFRLRRA
jgi:uncharacterized membrane protein YeiH